MAKRLTKSQKLEILAEFQSGKTSIEIAEDYCCSANTVSRTVKSLLGIEAYEKLKEVRNNNKAIVSKQKRESLFPKKALDDEDLFSKQLVHKDRGENTLISQERRDTLNENFTGIDSEMSPVDSSNLSADCVDDFKEDITMDVQPGKMTDRIGDLSSLDFNEVVPLIAEFGFDSKEQKIPVMQLKEGVLPETVYMLVDKKVELEFASLREFPDWNFLPEEEKDRKVISLFRNHREAKKNMSRGQRVIKIPNPNVFLLSAPFLISQGVTRIIIENDLITLD